MNTLTPPWRMRIRHYLLIVLWDRLGRVAPAAKTCEPHTGFEEETDYELLSFTVVLDCRATFVATSMACLGP